MTHWCFVERTSRDNAPGGKRAGTWGPGRSPGGLMGVYACLLVALAMAIGCAPDGKTGNTPASSDALGRPEEIENSIGMTLKLIPAGEFLMGSPEDKEDRNKDEGPQHRVRITQPFYLGETEVTQGQWEAVMGSQPWSDEGFVEEGSDYAASYISVGRMRWPSVSV